MSLLTKRSTEEGMGEVNRFRVHLSNRFLLLVRVRKEGEKAGKNWHQMTQFSDGGKSEAC